MLIVRSASECHLYMGLHPCACEETRFDTEHFMRTGENNEMQTLYRGACVRCGLQRQFVFELAAEVPPPPPAFGGPAPSSIICPGQFAAHAARCASSSPDRARVTRSASELTRGVTMLEEAVAAYDEVVKFLHPHTDAVPESAFTSHEGLTLLAAEPARFRRSRLTAVRDALRKAIDDYSALRHGTR